MQTKWIKDTDSGELYPVVDDFEFEVPSHLQESEYTPIDYDKTTEMTVLQLPCAGYLFEERNLI